MGQESETLYLLILCQLLLQGIDALHQHLVYLSVLTQVAQVDEVYMMHSGIFFQETVVGHDKCRDILFLVGDDGYLVDVFVDDELRLNHLRSNVLAVAGLEEVFDALLQEKLAVLHIA